MARSFAHKHLSVFAERRIQRVNVDEYLVEIKTAHVIALRATSDASRSQTRAQTCAPASFSAINILS